MKKKIKRQKIEVGKRITYTPKKKLIQELENEENISTVYFLSKRKF